MFREKKFWLWENISPPKNWMVASVHRHLSLWKKLCANILIYDIGTQFIIQRQVPMPRYLSRTLVLTNNM